MAPETAPHGAPTRRRGARLRLDEVARAIGARLRGDGARVVEAMAPLARAGPGELSFLANRRYVRDLASTRAEGVILGPEDVDACPVAALVHDNPYLGYALAAGLIYRPAPVTPGVARGAMVHETARVSASAYVGPGVVIERDAVVGEGVYVGAGSIVGPEVVIGDGSRLVASVTLLEGVRVGRNVLLHPGVVVGADGFGIARDGARWVKIPQVGSVRIGDDVEVGANSTIDRGALEDTVIERGVKIDNQVQIAHNVHIGEDTAIAGCVAIAGSTRIGRRCTIGGAAAIAGHLVIGDDVHLTGAAQVGQSMETPGTYASGIPALPVGRWRRLTVRLAQLEDMGRRLRALERRLAAGDAGSGHGPRGNGEKHGGR